MSPPTGSSAATPSRTTRSLAALRNTVQLNSNYFKESSLPIYSAALILPFLLIYEGGLLLMRSDVINGGDAIVINLGSPLFHRIGVQGGLISVVFLGLVFCIWQFKRGGTWKPQLAVLTAMFFESLFYAVALFLLLGFLVQYMSDAPARPRSRGRMQNELRAEPDGARTESPAPALSQKAPLAPCARPAAAAGPELRDFVLYCGAGVFEEFVFRVLLLGLLVLVLTRLLHMEHAYAAAWSVFLGAFIFSAFHHIGGERFEMNIFLQRLFAGLYFSAIFYNRSFGVAAATHALYDIVVGLNQMRQ